MCGNVIIPYPFRIGGDCSVNQWYIIDCNSSKPYLSAFGQLEVLDVNTMNQTVTVNAPTISACQNSIWNISQAMSIDLGRSPFMFSKSHNKFVFEGCGNAVMMDPGCKVLTGCSTKCNTDTLSQRKSCFGISCCQSTITYYLKSYNINITRLARDERACRSAFLVDEASYVEGRFSKDYNSYVPLSLLWTLSERDILNVSCYYSAGTIEF
ncbi:putative wall-associated receptor kinase, galacturonan-binding domain-containing protein [Helianthus annuus]|uniref:Wall-associated receptor kinase, galacturonan-binding domain-containing protein n=1 Tax=Helianthus annuus TaxID=4232 RepID=A0A251S9D2_HELAN|nr:putative wall-associated receptor kinase, galacturonan-binding domain-containing protein [Helianthus annuus]KAJ0451978.1 putative wall-associated receptor kinase, galacturonan-binding domain-containing protein [Helianthus annuus]KAJ0456705.1 putative wall-associated receptor kinase, galacturonan-binding domain-containing protein [Helianthus annuus]KAJ0473861.1 putative wall-associated receptor kinase, galacturonan-binding domain-containing protein [Helianthus annuus]KAJ0649437.1 putative wal